MSDYMKQLEDANNEIHEKKGYKGAETDIQEKKEEAPQEEKTEEVIKDE